MRPSASMHSAKRRGTSSAPSSSGTACRSPTTACPWTGWRAGMFHSRLRWYLWESGDQESALADALEAVRLVPADPPSALRANVLGHAAGLLLFSGRIEESERLAREALALAQRVGAHEEEALALGVLGWDLVQTGRVEEGLARVREAWLIARPLGQITGPALAYNLLAALPEPAGRVAESLQVAEEGIE